MSTTVVVQEFGGGRALTLDAMQTRLFEAERKKIMKYVPAVKGAPTLVTPDCLITVSERGKKTEYELHANAILYHRRSRRSWQFYFGLLLLSWLYR